MECAENNLQKGSEFRKINVFADERKYNVFGSGVCNYMWRNPGEELKKMFRPALKHGCGGGVIV